MCQVLSLALKIEQRAMGPLKMLRLFVQNPQEFLATFSTPQKPAF